MRLAKASSTREYTGVCHRLRKGRTPRCNACLASRRSPCCLPACLPACAQAVWSLPLTHRIRGVNSAGGGQYAENGHPQGDSDDDGNSEQEEEDGGEQEVCTGVIHARLSRFGPLRRIRTTPGRNERVQLRA